MQGYVIKKNDPERCQVLIGDAQDLGKCENAVPDTIKKCEGGIPNIRFRGFKDDWEQRKLGGLCDITTGKLDANAMVQDGQFDFYTSGVDVYKIDRAAFEGPAITIAGNGASVGYMHLADGKFNAYQRTYVLTGFLADRQFLNVAIGNELPAKIQEEVRGSGIPYIVLNMLTELNIPFPSHNEQKQIGEFFRNLDHLITLHQRKCDETRELKKYMLQKMFPKEGEKVPEIRFQGFTGKWEQRKVGDLLIERNQQAPMSDEYPLMAFIANEGVAPKGERYDRSALVTDTVNKLYKKTEKGDFIYSSNNLETGSIGLNKYGKACISPVYSIFEPTGIADSDFLGRRLVRKDFINAMVKWRQGVIYGQWRIHESDFLRIEITVPSVEEQRKIGTYLDQLDRLITLYQRKCDKLKEIKRYMLQNMFPQKI